MEVVVQDSFEESLKAFKRLIAKDGIHTQIKRRLAFVKPSDKRKEKEIVAARRKLKLERKKEVREGTYEGYIRKQNTQIRIFNVRHSLIGVR